MAGPALEIVAPSTARPGESIAIKVKVTVEQATQVDYIDVRLYGIEGCARWVDDGALKRFIDEVVRVFDRGILEIGTHELAATFQLPADAPRTHDTTPAFAELRAFAHLHRDGWSSDVRRNQWIEIRDPSTTPLIRAPLAMRTEGLEISIASNRLAIGEPVVGTLVANQVGATPLDVTMQLDAVTTSPTQLWSTAEHTWTWATWVVQLPVGSDGVAVPFELPLSAGMTPSFRASTHARTWRLTVRPRRTRAMIKVPLEIVDLVDAPGPQPSPPEIGDQRLARAFAAFAAAHGWQLHARGQDDELGPLAPAIARVVGGAALELASAYTATGWFVVARVQHRSLGLGLEIVPSTPMREWFTRDIEADHAEWDSTHHVDARFAAQTEPFLRAVVPALTAAPSLGKLGRWTDGVLTFMRPASTVTDADLATMAAELEQVALVIEAARDTITPPPKFADDLPAWRELATWLHGELSVGDLSVTGSMGTIKVRVGVVWDDERPVYLAADVDLGKAASAELRAFELAVEHPSDVNLGSPLADRLASCPADVFELRFENAAVRAKRSLGTGGDAARARELVELLHGLLAGLSATTGPYR